ncbi:MAG: hypothetical protein EOM03_05000 [Clostridia bacterium]|nr:hypothetical protein [Clostridia bacterium]
MQSLQSQQYFPMSDFKTLNEMLDRTFQKHADQTAVVYRLRPQDEPSRVTYKQMQEDYLAVQQGLAEMLAGDRRVAITGENSYFWMLSYLAAVTGLGTVIPLDRLLQPEETIGLLVRSEADTLVCDASIYLKLRASDSWAGLAHLQHVVLMLPERLSSKQQADLDAALAETSLKVTLAKFADVLKRGHEIVASAAAKSFALPDPNASLILIFTSGTTANSKGVLLSHRSITADLKGIEGFIKLPHAVRMLSVLPLNHAFENTCGFLYGLDAGAEICISDGLRYIQQNMQEYKIQMIIGVPAIFEAFHKRIMANAAKTGQEKKLRFGLRLSGLLRKFGVDVRRKIFASVHEAFGGEFSMAIAGAAPMSLEIINFFENIGVRIMQGYGLTETSPVVAGCNTELFVAGTVGVAMPGVEVAIENEAPGETGEILIRGDLLMNGYYRDPEATAEAIDKDGWFHSGDLGAIDEKTGCLAINGRIKSLIVLESGKKVVPEELELLINQNGQTFVKDSLVFSQTDEQGKVVLAAKLVLDKDSLESIISAGDNRSIQERVDELIKTVNGMIPSFKRINTYFFSFQDMIRTTTLKVKRAAEIEVFLHELQKRGLLLKEIAGKNIDDYFADLGTGEPV